MTGPHWRWTGAPIDTTRSYQVHGPWGTSRGPLDMIQDDIRTGLLEDGGVDSLLAQNPDPMSQELIRIARENIITQLAAESALRVRDLRANIVRVAEREYNAWFDPDPDTTLPRPATADLTERQPAGRALVSKYWREGLNINYTDAQLGDATFQDGHPWSAAFVSYVMRDAGAGSDFNYASGHAGYVSAAIQNRKRNISTICKAYRLTERIVEAGDIVVAERDGSGATYENPWGSNGHSHGDIVTRVDAAQVRTLGGNVRQNVDSKLLTIDSTGHLTAPHYFAIIKWEPAVPSWI